MVLEVVKGSRRGMKPTEFTVSLLYQLVIWYELCRTDNVPNAEELDRYVDREGFLERIRLLPSDLIDAGEHLVGERNLLVVACG